MFNLPASSSSAINIASRVKLSVRWSRQKMLYGMEEVEPISNTQMAPLSPSVPVGLLSSNYREVQAVNAATEHLIAKGGKGQNIVLLTDSLSALQSLMSGPTDHSTRQLQNNLEFASNLLLLPLAAATISTLIIMQLLCSVCLFSYQRPLGLLLRKGENGIFNVCNDLSACWAHGGNAVYWKW